MSDAFAGTEREGPVQLTTEDTGKPIVTADDEVIGAVENIYEGKAYVTPSPGLFRGYGSWIGAPFSEDDFILDPTKIADVREDAIVLHRNI